VCALPSVWVWLRPSETPSALAVLAPSVCPRCSEVLAARCKIAGSATEKLTVFCPSLRLACVLLSCAAASSKRAAACRGMRRASTAKMQSSSIRAMPRQNNSFCSAGFSVSTMPVLLAGKVVVSAASACPNSAMTFGNSAMARVIRRARSPWSRWVAMPLKFARVATSAASACSAALIAAPSSGPCAATP